MTDQKPVFPRKQRKSKSIFRREGQQALGGRTGKGKGSSTTSFGTAGGHRGSTGHGTAAEHDDAQSKPSTFTKTCQLRVHEVAFSCSDLVLNPSFFPGVCVGDIVAIRPVYDADENGAASPRGSLDGDPALVAHATGETTPAGKGKGSGSVLSPKSAVSNVSGAHGTEDRLDSRISGRRAESGKVLGDARKKGKPGYTSMQSRWHVDMPDSDVELLRERERLGDDEEEVLKPDPHCEILVRVGEVKQDAQQLQASIISSVARTLWGEYQSNQKAIIRKINVSKESECELIRADYVEIAFRDQY
ncbi:hypothetical protein EC988_004596, partial [Linderina pennispora]